MDMHEAVQHVWIKGARFKQYGGNTVVSERVDVQAIYVVRLLSLTHLFIAGAKEETEKNKITFSVYRNR